MLVTLACAAREPRAPAPPVPRWSDAPPGCAAAWVGPTAFPEEGLRAAVNAARGTLARDLGSHVRSVFRVERSRDAARVSGADVSEATVEAAARVVRGARAVAIQQCHWTEACGLPGTWALVCLDGRVRAHPDGAR